MGTKNRYAKMLNSLHSSESFSSDRPSAQIEVRGAFLGLTDDGWKRYAINWAAIDPPRLPKEVPPREKPYERVTLATATQEQVRNALHKALIR